MDNYIAHNAMLTEMMAADHELIITLKKEIQTLKKEIQTLKEYPSKQEILNTISDAVYAQYPKKEWQRLSDDEISDLITHYEYSVHPDLDGFARDIEQASMEKNLCT